MHEIETWISEAATTLGLPLKRKAPEEGREVVKIARDIYVEDDPRVWWLRLKLPSKQVPAEELGLTEVLPSREGTCWLIPETDAEELPVYEFDAKNVERVIRECPYFEYYVLAQDFSWLVAESDHNVFFVCERPRPPGRQPSDG
ncbi:MAG: hypothetical protein KIT83_08505 [Bryobacterales bacterium]|nr:hypothetical protein [Bryobacterales bacterium]